MIPKVIHYCWFGRKPLPKAVEKCIASWKKLCPDFEIIQWNEDNYDLSQTCPFVREAYAQKKWAFVSDYVRLDVVYRHGGIYMDTDVEVLKPLQELLDKFPGGYMGMEQAGSVNSGIGFAAEKGNEILCDMLTYYKGLTFEKASMDQMICPVVNTQILVQHGFSVENGLQKVEDLTIFPSEYLCPENIYTGVTTYTENTYTVHHYDSSWMDGKEKVRLRCIVGIKKMLPKKMVEHLRKTMRK